MKSIELAKVEIKIKSPRRNKSLTCILQKFKSQKIMELTDVECKSREWDCS